MLAFYREISMLLFSLTWTTFFFLHWYQSALCWCQLGQNESSVTDKWSSPVPGIASIFFKFLPLTSEALQTFAPKYIIDLFPLVDGILVAGKKAFCKTQTQKFCNIKNQKYRHSMVLIITQIFILIPLVFLFFLVRVLLLLIACFFFLSVK